jgi:hypothetical protein
MAKLICVLKGVRGRSLKLYDTKCVITTSVTAGSLLTHNATDGEKTVFLIDVVGVQFKQSGFTIGYLQLETPSIQMNNKDSNFFSENTFTFEDGKNGVSNQLMQEVYKYVVYRVESLKYGSIYAEDNTDEIVARIKSLKASAMEKPDAEYSNKVEEAGALKRCPHCGVYVTQGGKCYLCGKDICF